ncbi:MAG: tetratricopeptide repeat protein [Terracidiphilus sp.]|jgi:tetratricopeptide (TPR) repeat protein
MGTVQGSAQTQEAAPQFDDLAARAAAARDSGNLPLAIDLYGQAEQVKPDWAEGWFYLGMLQYSANAYPAAIDAFNHLLALQPGVPPGLALRGLCEFETGAYDEALRDLEQAVAKGAANQPRNEQILRYHLAELLTRSSRFQDALAQYKFFTAKNILDEDVLVGLGLAGMRTPLLTKDVAAGDRELYKAAGAAGYTLLEENTQLADRLFTQLFARYPATPGIHFFYGFLLFPHSPDLAIEQFKSEVAIAPGNVEAHAMLAFTLMIAGRYAEAEPEAEMVVAKAPDMEMGQLALGRSLAEIGDVKRGTDLLNQVLQNDPDNLEAHLGLASIYSRTGRREDAYREHMVCRSLAK